MNNLFIKGFEKTASISKLVRVGKKVGKHLKANSSKYMAGTAVAGTVAGHSSGKKSGKIEGLREGYVVGGKQGYQTGLRRGYNMAMERAPQE